MSRATPAASRPAPHWPHRSSLVSGGGIRVGQAIGATDARGEYVTERSLSPNDLLATVYHHELGNRPQPRARGRLRPPGANPRLGTKGSLSSLADRAR